MNIKELRTRFHLSQQDLADRTGIPRPRIAKWEEGKANPKTEDYNKLANLFQSFSEVLPPREELKDLDTGRIILGLTESTKNATDSNKAIAESNRVIAESNNKLAEGVIIGQKNIDRLISILLKRLGMEELPALPTEGTPGTINFRQENNSKSI